MRTRYYLLAYLAVLLAGIAAAVFLLPAPRYAADPIEVNDLSMRLRDRFDSEGNAMGLQVESVYDYVVIDSQGDLLFASRPGLSEDVFAALRRGDFVVDIAKDGEVLAKLIIANDIEAQWQAYRNSLLLLLGVILAAVGAITLVFFVTLHRQILRPFQGMRGFAQRIAAGELDAPLQMDRRNIFGAFTESFDLMRDELRRARENEQAAERSKRELVAALSHDIQTPVSSIKAVAELMQLSADEETSPKLRTIQDKADQIQSLVTELFQTTLAELDTLNVQTGAVPSDQLELMIKAADYQGLIQSTGIPDCLVSADATRLAQVMDNIIANSYKYAGTPILLSAEIEDRRLMVSLRDYGPGVPDEELPLLYSKYYRGASAAGKPGYGLGLFIAHYLVERMGGQLDCINSDPGFAVRIWLQLDG